MISWQWPSASWLRRPAEAIAGAVLVFRFSFALALVLAASEGARAQPIRHLTFAEALTASVETPGVRRTVRELAVREREDEGIGGTVAGTQLTLMPGGALTRGDGAAELQINATQGWTLADVGGARRATARRERDVLGAEARAAALAAQLEVARAWIDVETLRRDATEVDARAEIAARRVAFVERALALGRGTRRDLAEARALRAAREGERRDLAGRQVEAQARLATLVGEGGQLVAARGPLPEVALPRDLDPEPWLRRVDALPAVEHARLDELVAESRAHEARTGRAPELHLGAQLERAADAGWVAYGVATIQADFSGSARRGISRETATAVGAELRRASVAAHARANLFEAFHEVEHTAELLAAVRDELLPAREEAWERARRLRELGEIDVLALLGAEEELSHARELAVEAEGALVWARARLLLLLTAIEGSAQS